MEKLVAIQRDLQVRLKRSIEAIESKETAVTLGLVRSTMSMMDVRWRRFDTNHEKLITEFGDALVGTPYLTEDVAGAVESEFLRQRARLLDEEQALLLVAEVPRGARAEPTSLPTRNVLPRIQLPQFSGKFEDWPAFRDLFTSLVSNESTVSKVE